MFETRKFKITETEEMDSWLNGLRQPGFGVKIANVSVLNSGRILITATKWKLSDPHSFVPTRNTIDEIPEEPTIKYDEHAEA